MTVKTRLRATGIVPCYRCGAPVRQAICRGSRLVLLEPDPAPDSGEYAVRHMSISFLSGRLLTPHEQLRSGELRMRAHECPLRASTPPPPPPPRQAARPSDTSLYGVLGVARTATAVEIRSAYRRLASQLHPDINPDPEAAERFKAITEAYSVLSDPEWRRVYDLTGRRPR